MAGKKQTKDNQIHLTRIYDAPVKAVWDAWTDPKQLVQWWGPRGFKTVTKEMQVKTGGFWSYVITGPDGTELHNKTRYLEVEKHSHMIYDHGGNDDQNRPPLFRVEVRFKENAGKTHMDMTMTFESIEKAKEIGKHIKKAGGDGTWDRLAEHLSTEDIFIINRSFNAPIDLMFSMWTDPKHFSQWLPPTGFVMKFHRAEIKVGASSFYSMSSPDGTNTMYGRANYLEITKPSRVVYTQVFCDEKENVIRHPWVETWPQTMLTTVTLTEEGPNRTRVTVKWEVYGDASDADRATFRKMRGDMTQGWTGSFDKLEEILLKE